MAGLTTISKKYSTFERILFRDLLAGGRGCPVFPLDFALET